jgi:hypothetical protein
MLHIIMGLAIGKLTRRIITGKDPSRQIPCPKFDSGQGNIVKGYEGFY